MRVSFQNQQLLLALLGGLPATVVVVALAWLRLPTISLAVVATVVALAFWTGCAFALRRRLVFPLQALANLVEAIRFGDYTLRGRRAGRDDALGEVSRELNALGQALQSQRLASLEAAALVQTVLAELDAAVFAFDDARRLKLVNRAGAELLGRSSEALLGRPAAELGLQELLDRGESAVSALSFPARAGRFELKRREFREGGVPHVLLMVSDLSRTLRDEERRAWQRLIRVMGHEINNSLTPIKSLARTMRDMLARESESAAHGEVAVATVGPAALEDRADLVESLALIGDRADSLSKFVATYSQLARLPAPSRAPTSLRALLQRLAALAPFAGLRIEAPHEVSAEVDAGQLEQALINLLKNAVEANSTVQAAPVGAAGAVTVTLARTRDAAVIEVLDEGPGIANPDNLFVPFFTTKPGGSGIGLALSRQIVEGHLGTLVLENRTDRTGARARLVLPLVAR